MENVRFEINDEQKKQIVQIVVHGLLGIVITVWSSVLSHENYGIFAPIISTGITLITFVGQKWLSGKSLSEIQHEMELQGLQETIKQLQTAQQEKNPI